MKTYLLKLLILPLLLISCQKQEKKASIGILTPITHPSLEEIERGFKETMEKTHPGYYEFITYNAHGCKTLMHAEVEEALRKNHSMIFSIGTSTTQMISEVSCKKHNEKPIVFTCVNDPVGFNIVACEEHPGFHITGVKELLRFEDETEALLKYKPEIKRVLVVYNPMEAGLEKDFQFMKMYLEKKGIAACSLEIFQSNELLKKLPASLMNVDAVITLKDNTVVSGLETLIKQCNAHKIPLMASDLDSPDRGAAFGYGVREKDFGIEAAKKALQILDGHVKPGDIPVTPISLFSLKINYEAAINQGISEKFLSEKLLPNKEEINP